jgi:chorismate-pyruvate lyase
MSRWDSMVAAVMRPIDPSLTRFQRMLLGTDGTVTHILEAYADEPVEVVKLLQAFDVPNDADAELDVAAAGKVLRRRVVLRTVHSRRTLLYAEAVVAVDRVDPRIVDGLVATDKPIGILLAEVRTETFREILRVEREPAGANATHFGVEETTELISRTYRIVREGRPVILITEKFPSTYFRGVPA